MPLPGRKNNFQSTNLISPSSKDVKFMGRNVAEYVFMFLLIGAVGLVFYDISTSMTDQGIARGDAYQNAAAYPATLSILVIICVGLLIFQNVFIKNEDKGSDLYFNSKHVKLLFSFGCYLVLLDTIGYHLLTPALLFVTSIIYGERNWLTTLIYSIVVSLIIAFIFEELLNVVLPVGIFEIALPVLL